MRIRYRLQIIARFILFAFYPKVTVCTCIATAMGIDIILGVIMCKTSQDSVAYDILFALLTGVTTSFIVAIIVELANNYRHNKLAWQELHEYYSTIIEYETMKQVYMQHTPSQRAERKAREDAGIAPDQEDIPKDIIQATWEQLPKLIQVLKDTLENNKAFLTDMEIYELKNIVLVDYKMIWSQIHSLLMLSPILHTAVNHPDEESLNYPRNIIDDMPEWLRKHIAENLSMKAVDNITNEIMSDQFLLAEFMKGYDISQSCIDNYTDSLDEESENKDEDQDYDYDFSEPEDEQEFKAVNDEQNRLLIESDKPFVSWHISQTCKDISESLDLLEREILKKPYYGYILEHERKMHQKSLDKPLSEMAYEYERKRIEALMKNNDKI